MTTPGKRVRPHGRTGRETSGVAGAHGSRRQEYSMTTKQALVDVAEELFTEHGYAGTSLEAIVSGARVTKGALYHHFSGKRELFEAVFDRIEAESATVIAEAVRARTDPWQQAGDGLRAFLQVVREPRYRRILVQDGPSVLGYERFRQERRSTFGTLAELVRATLNAGSWDLDEDMLQTFSRVFFGALDSAGAAVATSDDPETEAQRVEAAVGLMFLGMQTLVDTHSDLAAVNGRAGSGGA